MANDPKPKTYHADSTVDVSVLPDFCHPKSVFLVVLSAELMALVITLLGFTETDSLWMRLGLISFFVQWVALGSTAILCLARTHLTGLSLGGIATIGYTTILVMTAGASLGAIWFLQGYFLPRSEPDWLFFWRNLLVACLLGAIALRYFYLQQQYRRRLESESEARVQALQARIQPHFLFNSMNIIASLTRVDPELAEQVVEDLAQLFRASLGRQGKLIPLVDELELCRRYLRIEQLRVGDRLQTVWAVELPDEVLIPPLSLQPLLENAIYHGIQPLPEGGELTISGQLVGNRVQLLVRNPKPVEKKFTAEHRRGNRMALENIQARLSVLFGNKAFLQTRDEGDYFEALIQLPLQTASDSATLT